MPEYAVVVKGIMGIRLEVQRQKDREDGPTEWGRDFALYLDRSAVSAHNLRAHPESQARSGIALGAHKWIKEPRSDLRLNPRSSVRDTQSNSLARPVPEFTRIADADL